MDANLQIAASPLLKLLGLLEARPTGELRWQAKCPAHEDGKASLSISKGKQHDAVLHCHAGCTTEQVLGAIGMKVSDLMPKPENSQSKNQIVASYDYVDENGNLQFQVIRFKPKKFRQRQPKEGGGWIWHRRDTKDVLYRLPEILKDKDRAVLLVEGEKDADNVACKLGMLATTNAGGAKKFRQCHADSLRGRKVILVPDQDPSGRKHVDAAASLLRNVAKSVTIVELPVGKKQDVSDWIAKGGTREQFHELIKPYKPLNSEVITKPKDDVWEADDDPHRLARVNLKRYEAEHGGKLVFWKEEVWKYKDGCYRKIAPKEFRNKVNASVREELIRAWQKSIENGSDENKPVKKVTETLVSNVIAAMASQSYVTDSVSMSCWLPDRNKKRNLISMKNGILDLDAVFADADVDDCLIPHTPDWFSSVQLAYDFDANADCPKWLQYLQTSLAGDQERINLLQEWAGYLLTQDNKRQKFMVLEGEGSNGKTVFFAAMTAMIGTENISHVSLENFGGRFDLSTTLGKLANICGDVGEIDQVAEGILKQFTGGETMQFDRKNLSPQQERPTAKLMFAWNNAPRFRDRSKGLWRRLLLVPFDQEIRKENRIHGMDNPEWWLDAGEVSGILNWAIHGLFRLNNQKEFTEPKICQERLSSLKIESNPMIGFLEDVIEEKEFGWIETSILYKEYRKWCTENGCHPLGNALFGKEIRRHFPQANRVRKRILGKLIWCYEGIEIDFGHAEEVAL